MKNYVAYHSASVMGRPYEHEPGSPFVFSSSKSEGFLRSMLGHPTWVVASEKRGAIARYSLAGVFTPLELEADGDIWDVTGPGTALSPLLDVTNEPWFALLLKEQANFSLGLNVIKSEEVVAALTRALSFDDRAPAQLEESPESFEEGKSVRVVVNRYERDRAARAACLEANGRICVVCRVDLTSVYEPIAAGVIHVHHLLARIPTRSFRGAATACSDLPRRVDCPTSTPSDFGVRLVLSTRRNGALSQKLALNH